jgi:hypothetical protein
MKSNFAECRIINLPRYTDHRGSLSVIDWPGVLPFQPSRFYYLYELPTDARRGCHAHKTENELMLALAGRFKVDVPPTPPGRNPRVNGGRWVHETLGSGAPGNAAGSVEQHAVQTPKSPLDLMVFSHAAICNPEIPTRAVANSEKHQR